MTGSQPIAVLKPVEVQQPGRESEQQLLVPEVMSLNRLADFEAYRVGFRQPRRGLLWFRRNVFNSVTSI